MSIRYPYSLRSVPYCRYSLLLNASPLYHPGCSCNLSMVKNDSMWCVHPHQYSSLLVMPPNCHFSPTFDSFFILSLHIMDLSNLASFLGFSMFFQLYISVLQAKPHACVLSSCSLGDHDIVSHLLHCSPLVHSSKKFFFLALSQLIFQSFLCPMYI